MSQHRCPKMLQIFPVVLVSIFSFWGCGQKNSADTRDRLGESDVKPVVDTAVFQNGPIAECDGDYYISQESEMSLSDLKNCGIVRGSIFIHYNPDMVSLADLSNLEEVTGQLSIVDNAMLTSLAELAKLRRIGENLSISNQPGLFSLKGLEKLERVGGSVILNSNFNLSSLEALSSLQEIGDDLLIYRQAKLEAFQFSQITSLRDLVISENEVLKQVVLPKLETIRGSVKVSENLALSNVDAIGKVKSIPGDLLISSNDKLSVLFTAESAELVEVKGAVTIEGNEELSAIQGFANLEKVRSLLLSDNASVGRIVFEDLNAIDDHLEVSNSGELQSIVFGSLDRVGGNVQIAENANLRSISFSEDLTQVAGRFEFAYNELISQISAPSLNSVKSFRVVMCNELENFSDLGSLTTIGESLELKQLASLTSLNGLSNLSGILPGNIDLEDLGSLASVADLSKLTQVKGHFRLAKLPMLTTLEGFEGLKIVNGEVTIEMLESLTSVSSLSSLSELGGNLTLSELPELASLSGFSSLTEIPAGYLYIFKADSLIDLKGLYSLRQVSGFIDLNANIGLTTLVGLGGLEAVGGVFKVRDHPELNFRIQDELGKLTSVGGYVVTGNELLPSCEVQSFFDSQVTSNGDADMISGNDDKAECGNPPM